MRHSPGFLIRLVLPRVRDGQPVGESRNKKKCSLLSARSCSWAAFCGTPVVLWNARRSTIPYWPCEISRGLANSESAKKWAWFILAVSLFGLPGSSLLNAAIYLIAMAGVAGVIFFDDFEFWTLHVLSVAVIFVASTLHAALRGWPLLVIALVVFVKGTLLVIRTLAVLFYEADGNVYSVAKLTRDIHLTGKARHRTTLMLYQVNSVAQWMALFLIACVFDT